MVQRHRILSIVLGLAALGALRANANTQVVNGVQWTYLLENEAVVVGGNGVYIAIEIDGFACNPSGAVHVGRINPHLADARHVLGKDADAAVVFLAADGKQQAKRQDENYCSFHDMFNALFYYYFLGFHVIAKEAE